MDPKELKTILRAFLISNPLRTTVRELQTEFRNNEGFAFPHRHLGYNTFIEYLQSIPDIVQVIGNHQHAEVRVVLDAKSSHVADMVARQKTTTKKRRPFGLPQGRARYIPVIPNAPTPSIPRNSGVETSENEFPPLPPDKRSEFPSLPPNKRSEFPPLPPNKRSDQSGICSTSPVRKRRENAQFETNENDRFNKTKALRKFDSCDKALIDRESNVCSSNTRLNINAVNFHPNQNTVVPLHTYKNALIPNENTLLHNQRRFHSNVNELLRNQTSFCANEKNLVHNEASYHASEKTLLPYKTSVHSYENTLLPDEASLHSNENTPVPNEASLLSNEKNEASYRLNEKTLVPSFHDETHLNSTKSSGSFHSASPNSVNDESNTFVNNEDNLTANVCDFFAKFNSSPEEPSRTHSTDDYCSADENVSVNRDYPTDSSEGESESVARVRRKVHKRAVKNDVPAASRGKILVENRAVNYKVPLVVQNNLNELIRGFPEGVFCSKLINQYKMLFGKPLKYQEFGYKTLMQMCCDLPAIFKFEPPQNGDYKLYHVETVPTTKSEVITANKNTRKLNDLEFSKPAIPHNFTEILNEILTLPPDVLQFNEKIPVQPVISDVDDYIDVQIAEVYDPSKFWFNLRSFVDKLNDLMDEMDDFYRERHTEYSISRCQLREGLYCVAMYSHVYHRAIVTKLLKATDDGVMVFFIDYGTAFKVPKDELCYLHRNFTEMPAQALRGRLAKIHPPLKDDMWSVQSTKYFLSLVRNKECIAQIVSKNDESSTFELIIADTSGEEDIFINDNLVLAGHAHFEYQGWLDTFNYEECVPIVENIHLYPTFHEIEWSKVPSLNELLIIAGCTSITLVFPQYFRKTTNVESDCRRTDPDVDYSEGKPDYFRETAEGNPESETVDVNVESDSFYGTSNDYVENPDSFYGTSYENPESEGFYGTSNENPGSETMDANREGDCYATSNEYVENPEAEQEDGMREGDYATPALSPRFREVDGIFNSAPTSFIVKKPEVTLRKPPGLHCGPSIENYNQLVSLTSQYSNPSLNTQIGRNELYPQSNAFPNYYGNNVPPTNHALYDTNLNQYVGDNSVNDLALHEHMQRQFSNLTLSGTNVQSAAHLGRPPSRLTNAPQQLLKPVGSSLRLNIPPNNDISISSSHRQNINSPPINDRPTSSSPLLQSPISDTPIRNSSLLHSPISDTPIRNSPLLHGLNSPPINQPRIATPAFVHPNMYQHFYNETPMPNLYSLAYQQHLLESMAALRYMNGGYNCQPEMFGNPMNPFNFVQPLGNVNAQQFGNVNVQRVENAAEKFKNKESTDVEGNVSSPSKKRFAVKAELFGLSLHVILFSEEPHLLISEIHAHYPEKSLLILKRTLCMERSIGIIDVNLKTEAELRKELISKNIIVGKANIIDVIPLRHIVDVVKCFNNRTISMESLELVLRQFNRDSRVWSSEAP